MNKKFAWTLFTLLLVAFSCSDSYEGETLVFNKYLGDTFGLEITDRNHTYLIESTFQCAGCVDKTYLSILNHAKSNHKHSITIITFDNGKVSEQLKTKLSVLVDEDAKYESLGIPFGNITIIETQAKRIKSIRSIQLPEIDSTIQSLFQ